ncbi:hypothetical protein RB195_007835 [Necator americanus]|uniref:Phospholipid-transporting ATPase n=1 Tax=Necator americanus TaxID=51031 RepID=A0ABR1C2W1_NECAM
MSWLPLHLYKWRRSLSAKGDAIAGAQEIMQQSRSEDPNIKIKLGQRPPPSNIVQTNYYTVVNFLPKFLFAQFKQIANLFFLVLSVIQFLPGLSPFGRQATVVPLSFIIGTSAIREIYEDLRRRVRDRKVNYQKCYAHTNEGWKTVPWCQLHVGQLIRAGNGEQMAADCLILATSEPGSVAYVETANLDGESSLKVRQAAPTRLRNSEESMNEFWRSETEIYYDAPNRNIYEFQGYMTGKSTLLLSPQDTGSISSDLQSIRNGTAKDSPTIIGLSNAHVILRGARLKNTDNIFGIVLYTGPDTKLIQNNIKRVIKSSLLASLTNSVMLTQFGIVLLLCLAHALLGRLSQPVPFLVSQFTNHFDDSLMSISLQCLVLFSGFIPISLYVTLEMVQIMQGMFIHKDEKMIDEHGKGPDVKMFSLNSELGNRNSWQIREFLTACAICHTATPDKNSNSNGRPLFHATSPDEYALLNLAADAGYVFIKRPPGKCVINARGKILTYDIAAILEFDSIRKRMSVVVRAPNGQYKLYIKGADQKIFERLHKVSQKEMKRTSGHLQQFAIGGYRTLCFAVRNIDKKIFEEWYKSYRIAMNDVTGRKDKLAKLAEEIEKNLTLIGVSAIEDRLQKNVPETVARLLSAGIRVWVLTGDKLETAVNIGNSCRLLSVRAPMMVLSSNTENETKKQLKEYLRMLGKKGLARRDQHISLIVDATCLDHILDKERERDSFLQLALCCSSVICCRCTPIQKAAVTRLVKGNVSGAVLAIGDGANDVAMLQEADVGIGISGQEGMQAALASDYTITQFHHLDRLLFVHGTLSLFRTSKCILFSLYKNILETIVLSSFTWLNGQSVQTIADEWTILYYNMFFTSFPALVMGILDRPAPIAILLKYPQIYPYYQNSLSNWSQFRWCLCAVIQALIIAVININYWNVGAPLHSSYGADSSLWVFGMFIYWCLVSVANIKALLETNAITVFSLGTGLLSIGLLAFSIIFNTYFSLYIPILPRHVGGMLYMLPLGPLVLVVALVIVATMVPDLALKVFRRALRADMQDAMLWQEGFRGPNFNLLYQPIFKMCDIVGLKTFGGLETNRYGFAFSQDDGLAITQTDLLRGCSDSCQTMRTTGIEESDEKVAQVDFVKPNDRSMDDRTVMSSVSYKSPPQTTDINRTPNSVNEI